MKLRDEIKAVPCIKNENELQPWYDKALEYLKAIKALEKSYYPNLKKIPHDWRIDQLWTIYGQITDAIGNLSERLCTPPPQPGLLHPGGDGLGAVDTGYIELKIDGNSLRDSIAKIYCFKSEEQLDELWAEYRTYQHHVADYRDKKKIDRKSPDYPDLKRLHDIEAEIEAVLRNLEKHPCVEEHGSNYQPGPDIGFAFGARPHDDDERDDDDSDRRGHKHDDSDKHPDKWLDIGLPH